MTAILLSMLLAAPLTGVKQGGLPPMLINPDAYSGQSSDGLPSNLGPVMDQVLALPGASFGLGVVDLQSGERITRNGSRQYQIDTPDIVMAAYSVARHNSGEFRLDTLVRHQTQLWMLIRDGQQGSRERLLAAIIHCGNFEPLHAWLAANYPSTIFSGVARDWEGAPETDPNFTTPDDCLDFMEITYGSLDNIAVRRMTSNPPLSDDLELALGDDNIIYGWISSRGDTRSINLIISKPDGAKYGVCVLANDLCCPAKADLGFTTIWNAL